MAVELADINAFDSMDILEFLDFEPVMRLSKDVRMAARNLRSREIRYLVDTYYQIQDYRCQLANQIRALKEAGEPTEVVEWLYQQQYGLEQRLKSFLNEWTNHNIVASWAKSITGIGPIIAAGLCAHIDITKAPTVGHIWRFAGLDPTVEWLPGQKRPWNARLKTLCWKIGESFVKVKNNPKDVYGKIYEARKAYENEKNERGDYSEQAKLILSKKKIGKDTIAYQYYSEGKLPPGHIHARAKRYAVKLFLSAFHEIAYFVHYGALPPKPYVIEHLGHVDYIAPPNTHLIPGYQEARGMNI